MQRSLPASDLQQITYDLHQLPAEALEPLRDSLITLLQTYSGGPRPIRTQICVCLASLAIQMPSWKNVLGSVGSALGSDNNGGDCLLDFLRILPEEVTEGRKVNLTVCSTSINHLPATSKNDFLEPNQNLMQPRELGRGSCRQDARTFGRQFTTSASPSSIIFPIFAYVSIQGLPFQSIG
jgi:hypothetical protein